MKKKFLNNTFPTKNLSLKKILMRLLIVLPIIILASCNKEPTMYEKNTVEDQMNVQASPDTVKLSVANGNDKALTFRWNKAQDRGYNSTIHYYIQFFLDGSTTIKSDLIELGENILSYSITQEQLDSLITSWGYAASNQVAIEAKILAKSVSDEKYLVPEVSSRVFYVSPYNMDSPLYIVLNADGEDQKIEMTTVKAGKEYAYTGTMPACSFYFTFNLSSNNPYYGYVDNSKIECLYTIPTNLFTISDSSSVYVDIDIQKLTYQITYNH
jgi:hypothetical protein